MKLSRNHLDGIWTTLADAFGEDISRRSALRRLAGGGLAVTLGTGSLRMAPRAAAQDDYGEEESPAPATSPGAGGSVHRYALGGFDLRVFDDGPFSIPPPFFAINAGPEEYADVLSEAGHTPEVIASRSLVLLIDTGDHRVLIDTGAKGFAPGAGQLMPLLQAEGIAPEEIDTVVISHLHADHFLGALSETGTPVFPNARHVINRAEYEFWWAEPSLAELAIPDDFKALFRDGAKGALTVLADRIEQIEPETEVVPGVKVIAAYGHTPGHLAIEITSGDETLLHVVDAAADPVIHLQNPGWFFASDNWPSHEILSRRMLFDRAADEGLLVQTYHFPFPGVGRVARDGDGWLWEPAG